MAGTGKFEMTADFIHPQIARIAEISKLQNNLRSSAKSVDNFCR
jgi:hypothetical protein